MNVQNLARQILTWPLQLSAQVNNEKYLLVHAMTSKPECTENKYYYLMGNEMNPEYLHNGIEEMLTTIKESDIPDVPLEERRQIKKIGFAC